VEGVGERLEERLDEFLCRLPTALERDFRHYRMVRLAGPFGARALNPSGIEGMYWLRLPEWLLSRPSPRQAAGAAADLLADVRWAQYCVFLAVRARDDLFDGQASLIGLEQVADRLLLAARGTLERHFAPRSPTLRFLAASIRLSQRAILEVDRLQRMPGGMPAGALPLYAEVGRVFRLGSVAICAWTGRTEGVSPTGRFCDHLAVAGQIVDDLDDMLGDLAQGRVNYAAARLLDGERAIEDGGNEPPALIARALLRGTATAALLERVRTHLRRAGRAVESLRLRPAGRFVADRLIEVDELATSLHRRLVDCALGTTPTPNGGKGVPLLG